MNRQEKISFIQEKIGRKDLTNGCWVILEGGEKAMIWDWSHSVTKCNVMYEYFDTNKWDVVVLEVNVEKILGHDVLLSDVLNFDEWFELAWYSDDIIRLWDLSKPTIQDQSDELIDFIFDEIC